MRDSEKIREWMRKNRWRQCDIQRELNYDKNTPVWETITGRRSSRRVLRWLIEKGCPVGYLALPNDIDPRKILKAAA